jgi:lysophospholipase L1-like esterase
MKITIILCGILLGVSLMAEVINAGIGGHSSGMIMKRYQKDVLAQKPDLVILLAGTNDSLNSYVAVSPDVFKQNLLKLVDLTQARGIKILLIEIPPAYEAYLIKRHKTGFFSKKSAKERIEEINNIIFNVAKDKKLPLVKIHDLLLPVTDKADCLIRNRANSKSEDGVHPTPEGYKLIAKAVYHAIKINKLSHKKIVCIGDSITYGVHVKKQGTADLDAETYPGKLAGLLQKNMSL